MPSGCSGREGWITFKKDQVYKVDIKQNKAKMKRI